MEHNMEHNIEQIKSGKRIRTKGNTVRIPGGCSQDLKVLELALKKLQDIYGDKTSAKRSRRNQIN